jgi:hypothetical protein
MGTGREICLSAAACGLPQSPCSWQGMGPQGCGSIFFPMRPGQLCRSSEYQRGRRQASGSDKAEFKSHLGLCSVYLLSVAPPTRELSLVKQGGGGHITSSCLWAGFHGQGHQQAWLLPVCRSTYHAGMWGKSLGLELPSLGMHPALLITHSFI